MTVAAVPVQAAAPAPVAAALRTSAGAGPDVVGALPAGDGPLAGPAASAGEPSLQRQFATASITGRRTLLGRQRVRPLPLAPVEAPAAPAVADVAAPEPPVEEVEPEAVEEAADVVVPAPPAEAAAPAATDPKQLAALADALYPQLMRRMRHEVLLDRERRGIRTDRRLP